jgi:hypothetical protein
MGDKLGRVGVNWAVLGINWAVWGINWAVWGINWAVWGINWAVGGIKFMKKWQSSDLSMSFPFSFSLQEAAFSCRSALKTSALRPLELLNAFFSVGWGTGWLCGI